jgi:hypothetical protein
VPSALRRMGNIHVGEDEAGGWAVGCQLSVEEGEGG